MGNRLRSLKGFSQRLNALERFRSNKLGNGGEVGVSYES